jgi:hypothetical protein
MNVNFFRAFAALAAAAVAIPAVAAETGDYRIGIEGEVPLLCRASVDSATVPATAGETKLGRLEEFCNSGAGYKVYADYSPELANAVLRVDGRAVPLDESGTALVSSSAGAAIASHDLVLSLPEGVSGGSISFRIVPA